MEKLILELLAEKQAQCNALAQRCAALEEALGECGQLLNGQPEAKPGASIPKALKAFVDRMVCERTMAVSELERMVNDTIGQHISAGQARDCRAGQARDCSAGVKEINGNDSCRKKHATTE